MDNYTNEEIEIDIWELLNLIRKKLWIIILLGTLFALAVGSFSKYMIIPTYTSKTQLYILTKSTPMTSLADIQMGTQLTQDYLVLIKSRPVVNQIIENLDLDLSYQEIVDIVSVSNPNNTRILEISVSHTNAYLAKKIADEFTKVATEQIATIMDTEKPIIVDEGSLPTEPSSPNIIKNTIIGGLLGCMLATGIVLILYMMDDTIKDINDVEKYLGLSTLGMIPIAEGKTGKVKRDKRKRLNKRQKDKHRKGKR